MNGEWGFCRYCIFEVPVEGGRLARHDRDLHGGGTYECAGSGREPTPQPGPEAEPVVVVPLKKSYTEINRRRLTREARVKRRAEAAAGAARVEEILRKVEARDGSD